MTDTTDFFSALREWISQARTKLEKQDLDGVQRSLFLIRGTSLVFGFFQIAHVTNLGESIAHYAIDRKYSGNSVRKYVDNIWDALTTLEYMIAKGIENTTDEQQILIFRLEATLKSFQDLESALTQSEVDTIVRSHERKRDLERSGV